ncbi:TPA: acetoacetyl-CoA reductase [Yersinia enterocolitica]|uniref:acetoacetyl-CoA reductase n=1 Tax=Yersinia enterocolitica TaxID=630 RepID=UPI0005DE1753|nr:acetoacetyl-CoA reductase [Yersinia enterocolitica]EKN6047611.1 acetoacetyl-CoA reductase [Yersinia enterocolitica]CQJ38103.1 3-ketoacyl-ACP reductase [Yersinia enterocolitica]HEN3245267.1 acetoacetyl-CoA reductase [Yersinia enterocolitica]
MKGKIALVTGGTRGIGSSIAKMLHNEGLKVIVISKNKSLGEKWINDSHAEGYDDLIYFPCDINDYASCNSLISQIINEYGSIDVLINNAGITRDRTFKKMSIEDWSIVLTTNLVSLFNITQPIVSKMIESKYGRIVNISSVNAEKGQFGQTNYCAAKAGVVGFTKALALELASSGITVNVVSPGYTETDMVLGKIPTTTLGNILKEIPIKRLLKPTEIAEVVRLLIKEDSTYITGANFNINGGYYM